MTDLVVLDFDRTLFNTQEFFQDFSTVLSSYYDIDGREVHGIAHRHNVVRAKATGIFSAFDQIRMDEPEVDVEQLKQTTRNELSGRDYLFVDAVPFLDTLQQAGAELIIMTVGTDEYQRFKAEFTPEINVYEFVVTQKTKATAISELALARKLDTEQVCLIDDRGDTFDNDLQKLGVRGVRIKRVDSKYEHIRSPSWVEEITSLGEFELSRD